MNRMGEWVALVCFVSLALLPWWVLARGFSWWVAVAALIWLLMGTLGAINPAEWQRVR